MRVSSLDSPFEPLFAKQFTRMWRADGSIFAAECVRKTILVAPPAYSFGLFQMERDLRHVPFDLLVKGRALTNLCL